MPPTRPSHPAKPPARPSQACTRACASCSARSCASRSSGAWCSMVVTAASYTAVGTLGGRVLDKRSLSCDHLDTMSRHQTNHRDALDGTGAALADPTRRLILERLRDQPGLTTGELALLAPQLSRFAVMKHIRVLQAADLVRAMDDGRRRRHFLEATALVALRTWLAGFAAVEGGPGAPRPGSGGTNR
ncbi:MAG: ArsR/SmtB family transcription factor [Candidatus Limnocylindrales bacterium]